MCALGQILCCFILLCFLYSLLMDWVVQGEVQMEL